MRRTRLPVVVALSLVSSLLAQGGAEGTQAPHDDYQALLAAFTEAQRAFLQKQHEICQKECINTLRKFQLENDPARFFIPRFQDRAAKYATRSEAIPYLLWLLTADSRPNNDVAKDALANLVVDHVESPEMEPAMLALEHCWRATGGTDAAEAIAEVLAKNDHVRARAAALFARAQIALQDANASREVVDEAVATLEKVVAMAPGASFAVRARSRVFEQAHLQVGQMAPDIAGRDLDGVELELSDYRGKVVLLSFWGDWCSHCRAMYRYQRWIVRDLAGKPFALVGVNSDPSLEALKPILEKENITWRSFWDGPSGERGPIATQWNVRNWPMVYLIDHKGVIRSKGHSVDGDLLHRLVEDAAKGD